MVDRQERRVADQQKDLMLMQRVATGDEQAVEELYGQFGGLVFKVARQLMPSKAEAEDAVQDIFIRLWQTADRFDPRRAKLVTWVMLIARRHLIDQLRRRSVRPKPTLLDEKMTAAVTTGEPGHRSQADERNAKLRQQIAQLPELQRVVIERAYLQGFTLREVSQQLDTPLGTVKSALSRGLNKLRDRSDETSKADWAAS
ncbi:MAG: sigma-70 family RNA polymerase sigma factor [Phycisphaerales bacterium]|nr:sigma-70 family RNA polymerase sigma factor [Phycisphaerales bacterium]